MEIITIVGALLGLLGSGIATPWGQAMTARYMRRVRQERALARLRAEPLYKEGAKIAFCVADTNGGAEVCFENHRILSMGVGRIVLQSLEDPALLTPMTGQEFEKLTVVIRSGISDD